MQIELRHLGCFICVAEELSYSRAADRLFITQQQVSQTIRRLEEIVEVKLFHRTTRTVSLTDAGVVLLPRARQILSDVQISISEAQMANRGELGRLVVSFSGYAIESCLPRVFHGFRKSHPQVHLEIREQNSAAQLDSLLREDIDAGFLISPQERPGVSIETLVSDEFVLLVPATLQVAGKTIRSLKECKQLPFVLVPRDVAPGFCSKCDQLFREAGFTPREVRYANNAQTVLGLTAAGAGVSLAPAFIQSLKKDGVKYVPVRSKVRVELALVSRENDSRVLLSSLREITRRVYSNEQLDEGSKHVKQPTELEGPGC